MPIARANASPASSRGTPPGSEPEVIPNTRVRPATRANSQAWANNTWPTPRRRCSGSTSIVTSALSRLS